MINNDNREAILNFLNENPGKQFTRKEISESLAIEGLSARSVSGLLLKLMKDGQVLVHPEKKVSSL